LKKKDQLTNTVFKSIGRLIFLRIGTIILNLAIIPLSIDYLNSNEFGFWITVSSIITWVSFFDLGLTNGLRNRITELVTHNKIKLAKIYTSSVAVLLTIIGFFFSSIFFCSVFVFDIQELLKLNSISLEHIHLTFLIICIAFFFQFVLNILNALLFAFHKSDFVSLLTFLGQFFTLIGILLLKKFTHSNLILLVIVFTIIPILINFLAALFVFQSFLKPLKPNVNYVNFSISKNILTTGLGFFVIQIGALILFQTDNFVISHLFGPTTVTEFSIGFKLFSFVSMLNFLIMTPYWSAFTLAWVKQDYDWMKKNLKIIRIVWLGFVAITILLYLGSDLIIDYWMGDKVQVSKSLLISLMIYNILITFQASHNYIVNGIGKLKLQIILMVISAVGNIPLSYYLGTKYGVQGVVYGNVAFILILGLGTFFQVNRLILKRWI